MKTMKLFSLITLILFFGCDGKVEPKPQNHATKTKLNNDSLKDIQYFTKRHFNLITRVFNQLHIDSLNSSDGEAYRLIRTGGWTGSEKGNPISITFHQNTDTNYVVIREIFNREDGFINKKVRFVSSSCFDTISKMFNSFFWKQQITDFNCNKLNLDGETVLYECYKNGKHKLISRFNCHESDLLKNAYYNFFVYSMYSREMTEDLIWYRENPPCCVKTPGPPSYLRNKKTN